MIAAEPKALSRRTVYAMLVGVVLVKGLNWPILVVGLESLTPIWMGAFRVMGAAVLVFGVAMWRGRLVVPTRHDMPIVGTLAVFHLAVVFVLVFTALQMVPAGRSSVVVWTSALWTVPIAAVVLHERMTPLRWTGLLIGVSGVVTLFEPWGLSWSEPGAKLGHFLLVMAAITTAGVSVHVRAHRWEMTPLEAMPWELLGASLLLGALGLVFDGVPVFEMTWALAGVMAYQSFLASGLAFLALVVVLQNLSPVSTNLTQMGVPVVGVLASAVFLSEKITTGLGAGLLLIIVGVALNLLSENATYMRRM